MLAAQEGKKPAAARRHRPHRPKVKGCYECSQRRIHCDRGEPTCYKCEKKGIPCSGLGIRYRFNDGVAARGLWAGKTIQLAYESEQKAPTANSPHAQKSRETSSSGTGSPDHHSHASTAGDNFVFTTQAPAEASVKKHVFQVDTPSSMRDLGGAAQDFGDDYQATYLNDVQPQQLDITCSLPHNSPEDGSEDPNGAQLALYAANYVRLQPPPRDSLSWAEPLFSHFSNHIACEMVAIDGKHNGYRHLLLPMARADELVMNAVMTVSAFHFLVQRETRRQLTGGTSWMQLTQPDTPALLEMPGPAQLYSRTLAILKRRHDLATCDSSTRHSVLLSLLVLLVGVTITGSEDFPILFRVLESALESMGGEDKLGKGDLPEFLVRQIRKMRVYAAPSLSEDTGVRVLSSRNLKTQVFECLDYCCEQQAELASSSGIIRSLVQQAQEIYLRRTLRDSTPTSPLLEALSDKDSITRVQSFKETLESFPPGAPGEQVLVWATFIAASDCILEEHKAFFREALMHQYSRSGFTNVVRGLEQLEETWAARASGANWTAELPRSKLFLM